MDRLRNEKIKTFVKKAPEIAARTLAAFLSSASVSPGQAQAQDLHTPGPRIYEEGRKEPSTDDYHYYGGPRLPRDFTPEQFREIMQGLPKDAQDMLDWHKEHYSGNQDDVQKRLNELRSSDGGRDNDLSSEDREAIAKSLTDTWEALQAGMRALEKSLQEYMKLLEQFRDNPNDQALRQKLEKALENFTDDFGSVESLMEQFRDYLEGPMEFEDEKKPNSSYDDKKPIS